MHNRHDDRDARRVGLGLTGRAGHDRLYRCGNGNGAARKHAFLKDVHTPSPCRELKGRAILPVYFQPIAEVYARYRPMRLLTKNPVNDNATLSAPEERDRTRLRDRLFGLNREIEKESATESSDANRIMTLESTRKVGSCRGIG